ncbi:MAG: hypothetical protein ACYDDI_07150 [Candidatus Acidiferrales bacterium]
MKELKEFCKRFGVTSLSDHGLCGFQTNETFCLYHFSTAREFQKKAHHFRWEWNDVSKEGVRSADRFGWILLHGKPDESKRCAERFFLAPRNVFGDHKLCKKFTLATDDNPPKWGRTHFLWGSQYSLDENGLRDKLKTL